MQKHLAARGTGLGLRVAVKTSGCSGLAYALEFVDEPAPEDCSFESFGVTLLVDPKSLAYIDGTELDYVREGLNEGFKFNNPLRPSAVAAKVSTFDQGVTMTPEATRNYFELFQLPPRSSSIWTSSIVNTGRCRPACIPTRPRI